MRPAILAAVLCGAVTVSVTARSQQEGIAVSNAWARPPVTPTSPAAAYFVVTDHGPADRLTGVSTPVAGRAELHESLTEAGVMKMRAVDGVPLETGKSVSFGPGGYHVMLMDLKQPLKVGENFPMTLTFQKAPPVTVQVQVDAKGRPAEGMSGRMMDMHGMHGMPTPPDNKP